MRCVARRSQKFLLATIAIEIFAESEGNEARESAPDERRHEEKTKMTTLLFVMPWVASMCGAVMIGKALRDWEVGHQNGDGWKRLATLLVAAFVFPSLAHAQAVDLQTATESGNAIIMYLSGTLAAVGIVAAGVAMMMGRQSIAKWAFAGAMICGLSFAIVKTMWSNFGLTPPDVSTFTP